MKQFEAMSDFFNVRAESYDNHMINNNCTYENYYNVFADCITETTGNIKILDLGAGTGMELVDIFKKNPEIEIVAYDLSENMTNIMSEKYPDKKIVVRNESFIEADFGCEKYDYIISSMSMHHFLYEDKLKLYKKINKALKKKGMYIEGDYVVCEEESENFLNQFSDVIKNSSSLQHIDIPFSLEKERKLFLSAGFNDFNIYRLDKNRAIYSGVKEMSYSSNAKQYLYTRLL